MIYFISKYFTLNTAPINRLLGFAKGLTELGLPHKIIACEPSDFNPIIDEGKYGELITFWPKFNIKNKLLQKIVRKMLVLTYCKWRLWRFRKNLSKVDTVLLLNAEFLHLFVQKGRKYKLYHEKNEHPKAYPCFSKEQLYRRYYDDLKKIDGLFVIQTHLKESFIELGVPAEKIHILNMMADFTRFENIVKDKDIEPYIAYCGIASNTKDGVDDLIKAFAIVSKQISNFKLYIIGVTPKKSERNSNFKLIDDLGLGKKIVFTGVVSASKMPQLLTNAKVLVLARPESLQAHNGFPTKLGEYLLTGNPVVITKTGAITDFLIDNENALLCEPKNHEQIAEKIIWSIKHPQEAQEIGIKGKMVALKNFNYFVETKKMVEVFNL